MRRWVLPAIIGVLAAVLAIVTAAAFIPRDALPEALPLAAKASQEPIIVIAVARNAKGTEIPVAIAPMSLGSEIGTALAPVDMPTATEGDRGRSVIDSYVFGGGNGVAEYLIDQGRKREWVVLRSAVWGKLLASMDTTVDVGVPVDAYIGGSLIEIPAGVSSLNATELAGVAGAADSFKDAAARRRVQRSLGDALARSLATSQGAEAVRSAIDGGTPTSLSGGEVDTLIPARP